MKEEPTKKGVGVASELRENEGNMLWKQVQKAGQEERCGHLCHTPLRGRGYENRNLTVGLAK